MNACRAAYEKEINGIVISTMLADEAKRDEAIDMLRDPKRYPIEITQEIKNRDMGPIPHPFVDHDPAESAIVMLDPVCALAADLFELQQAGEDVNALLHNGYIKLNNTELARVMPAGVIAVGAQWKST